MQILTIAGAVGKDSELRHTNGGDAVLGFSIAVDNGKDRNGEKREPTWYECSVWGDRAAKLQPYIKKGSRITAYGRPTVRVYEGKAYLGLSVNDLTFMSSAQSQDRDQASDRGGSGTQLEHSSGRETYDLNDDIPF